MLLSSETGRGEDDLKRRHRSSQSDDTSKAVKKSSSSGGGGNGGIALGSNAILPPSPLPARYLSLNGDTRKYLTIKILVAA